MAASVFIAKILGVTYLVVGIGIVNNQKHYRNVLHSFLKEDALMYLGGVISLVVGLVLVLVHNHWVADWRILVTLIGWLATIKGVVILVSPKSIHGLTRYWAKHMSLMAPMAIGIGMVFCYFGFVV